MASGHEKDIYVHKTQVLTDVANVPSFFIGKFEVRFGYDAGYDSETHFWGIRKLRCFSLFFPPSTYQDCYLMTAMAPLARRPWTGPENEEYEDLFEHTSMIYVHRPASVFSGCSSDVPLAQLRLGQCSSSADFWFGSSSTSSASSDNIASMSSTLVSLDFSQPPGHPAASRN